jgi:Asp-tRNA(Asn)/Glu-tRNA(Gln) amidotransferase A subunit family amidase
MTTPPAYDLQPVSLPRLAGKPFGLFVRLLESRVAGAPLVRKMLADLGIPRFRSLAVEAPPSFQPLWPAAGGGPVTAAWAALPAAGGPGIAGGPEAAGFRPPAIEDYLAAYESGRATPEGIAERALAAIDESDRGDPPLRAFVSLAPRQVMEDARAAAARRQAWLPLGPLDGVPLAVKDEFDLAGHPTRAGTSFLGTSPAHEDAAAVARWRAAGGVVLGKTNMHEIGIGVTGFNRHHGTPRNPYAPGHYTGGSSSGSAAAVAAGLCPLALGADAGGSIRIPAGLCGVVGLKPTYGRVSSIGAAQLAWSLDHYGPIAGSVRDAALGYVLLAGVDPRDPATFGQPPPRVDGIEEPRLDGLRLGIFSPWFDDADPAVVQVCRGLAGQFAELGAQVVEVEIPGLGAAALAHLLLVAGEMTAAMDAYDGEHRRDYGLDVRANLALARSFTARDYVKAQRVRTQTMETFRRVLETVDAVLTPATGVTAPAIRPDVLPDGESDLTTLLAIIRFAFAANLTGLPAIAFPAGYAAGLPVGMQAMGRPWSEHVLLRLARAAEPLVPRRRPEVFFDLLDG